MSKSTKVCSTFEATLANKSKCTTCGKQQMIYKDFERCKCPRAARTRTPTKKGQLLMDAKLKRKVEEELSQNGTKHNRNQRKYKLPKHLLDAYLLKTPTYLRTQTKACKRRNRSKPVGTEESQKDTNLNGAQLDLSAFEELISSGEDELGLILLCARAFISGRRA